MSALYLAFVNVPSSPFSIFCDSILKSLPFPLLTFLPLPASVLYQIVRYMCLFLLREGSHGLYGLPVVPFSPTSKHPSSFPSAPSFSLPFPLRASKGQYFHIKREGGVEWGAWRACEVAVASLCVFLWPETFAPSMLCPPWATTFSLNVKIAFLDA